MCASLPSRFDFGNAPWQQVVEKVDRKDHLIGSCIGRAELRYMFSSKKRSKAGAQGHLKVDDM